MKIGKGGSISGDSGGAALASLLISHFLNIPVRSDIAITGTVEADGSVGEVGGYEEKSFAAFSDPDVTTLIIPRTEQAIYESTGIAEFVATHRIIAAKNMKQVLRNALVTPELKLSLCEQDWLNALSAYRKGETSLALTYLQLIYNAVPEDLTCKLWYDWLKENGKLEQDIAFNERWAKDFEKQHPELLASKDECLIKFADADRSSASAAK